jgi:hypothetical protein
MNRRLLLVVSAAFIALLAVIPAFAQRGAAGPAASATCDRECLRGFMTQYLNAMVAHNPGTLPLADNVRFTEDTKEMKLGEGL